MSDDNPPPTPQQLAFQRDNLLAFAGLIFVALGMIGAAMYLVVH